MIYQKKVKLTATSREQAKSTNTEEEINLLKRNSASAVIQNQQTEIQALQASLEKEKEKIIALENYSRRENLFALYEHSREKRRELF